MRTQIYKSLLAMGVISIILTFILSAVLHYQGLQEQYNRELSQMVQTAAAAVSIDEKEESKTYLDAIYAANNEEIHIVWLTEKGSVLYDTDDTLGRNYLDMPEIQKAIHEGAGGIVQKSSDGHPKSYVACRTADHTILRFSRSKPVSFAFLSGFIPEIFLFFLVFFVGCLAAADRRTEKILKPIHDVGDLIQRIMSGDSVNELPVEYDELRPLINKVKEQHGEIQNYLEDIEEERNTIRTVIDTISDGIILLDSQREIVDYNIKTEEIFHVEKNKRFRRISFLYHDEDFLRAVSRAYHSEGRHEYTMNLFGRPFRMFTAKTELSDEETGLLLVFHDMTAYHMAEKMRREFSANVSHELKTPLTSISGFAEIIANGMYQNEQDVKLFAGRIVTESHRMMSLVDMIMHLSKVEETETTIKWKPVEIASLIRYACDLITPQAMKKGITMSLNLIPLYVYGNPALLSELIMNLMDNAVKYNLENGQITVSLSKSDDQVVLTVSDTGIGIPEEKQERIFERFYRAEESRNKATGGSGLGLSICKHIVEKHKGTLHISSKEGEGATFTVTLPVMSEKDVNAEEDNEVLAKQEAADGDSGKLAEIEAVEEIAKEIQNEPKEKKKKTKKSKKKK